MRIFKLFPPGYEAQCGVLLHIQRVVCECPKAQLELAAVGLLEILSWNRIVETSAYYYWDRNTGKLI